MKEIVIAVLALLGTLAGSYWSNRRASALIAYRLEQVEKKVDNLDKSTKIHDLEERVTRIETVLEVKR